jgi:hypothetical protein
MFVRFRQTTSTIQVSIAVTSRVNGKVKQEHVAALGSVEVPLTVRGRLDFWKGLHERLARLSNRVDAATVLGKVHDRIPMVTPEEQRELQLENAKEDERFWSGLHEMNNEQAKGHADIAANAERTAMEAQGRATAAASKATEARERITKIEKGEVVQGGLGKSMTPEDVERILREQGWSTSDLKHCRIIHALSELGLFDAYVNGFATARERMERRRAIKMLRTALSAIDED